MRGNVLTPSIKSTFDNPVLWGRDPHHGTDTLRRDHTYSNVHFVIRYVSVFGVNNHELSGCKSRTP